MNADVFAEWLEGCDGARLGRAAWHGAPDLPRPVLSWWRATAAAHGLRLFTLERLVSWLDRRTGARWPFGVAVVVESATADQRTAFAWLRLGLSGIPVAGIVASGDPATGWAAWSLDETVARPSRRALAVAEAATVPRWGGSPGTSEGRPVSCSRRHGGAIGHQPRTPPVRRDLATRARGLDAGARAASKAGKWRNASWQLAAAARWWLAAGQPCAAVRAVIRLALARLRLDDVVGADLLAACAEVASHGLGRHRRAARHVAELVALARAEAHVRAWQEPSAGRIARPSTMRPRSSSSRPPGRGGRQGGFVDEALIEVLQAGHHEEDYPAIARVCSVVRDRLGASAVAVVALGEPAPLAGAGHAPLASDELLRKATGALAEISPTPGRSGVEAAMPVRFAGAPVGVLCCRWGSHARVDEQRARTLLAAAASVCAPSLHALLHRRPLRDDPDQSLGLLGVSAAMGRVREAIRRAAAVPFPVLIEGESGSGKELVARAIHRTGARQRRQFCAINCAAISDELFEAEVFGHARGAFTGALADRAGLFEEADGGTLFLDEIAELSLRGQAKLLRVLQEGEVRRLGENLARRVDVRLVAASNRSLAREAAGGRFRDDLRFRLDVVRIAVPPLRDRAEDVPLLADHFWRQALDRTGGRARLDEATLDLLVRYQWPGNVRELQNLMATLAVRAPARGRVRPSDLPVHVTTAAPASGSLDEARRHFDARFVSATLARCGGRRAEAARRLGMSRQGLAKLLARLGLDADPA